MNKRIAGTLLAVVAVMVVGIFSSSTTVASIIHQSA
jgi:hypothetical protein